MADVPEAPGENAELSAEEHAVPIFVVAGQSNAVGRGSPSELPAEVVQRVQEARVMICFDQERHRPAEAHTSTWTALTAESQFNPVHGAHFGLEWSVADAMVQATGRGCHIAKFGMGSSSLVMPGRSDKEHGRPEWDPDGEHFAAFVEFLRDAVCTLGRPAYLAGVVWNQGNSDASVKASNGSTVQYTEKFIELVTRLRHDLQEYHQGLPIVACHVRKGSKPKSTKEVNAAISKACSELEHAACVEVEPVVMQLSLVVSEPVDMFHFDSRSLLQLGTIQAELLKGLLGL